MDINIQSLFLVEKMCYALFNRLSEEKLNSSLNKGARACGNSGFAMINLDILEQDIRADF